MSNLKSKQVWILVVLVMSFTFPVRGQDVLGCDEDLFKRVVKTTFNQRRKMLRVSLRQLLPQDSPFFSLHSDLLTRRPEQLTIQEFVALTNDIAESFL